ncbi:MAG: hypothetical protein IJ598_13405 [Ruminococcus sp.]|nr:hypothetical protein [Ruminococcus sp.]
MMIKNIKKEMSESAQNKLRGFVEQSVEQAIENKLHKEIKKVTRALTVKFIITGAVMAGALVLVNNADKIVNLLMKQKEK